MVETEVMYIANQMKYNRSFFFFWYTLTKKVHAYDQIQYTKTILRRMTTIVIIIVIVKASNRFRSKNDTYRGRY